MPHPPIREATFNRLCYLAGTTAEIVGVKLRSPVFIIGSGRCGTSLLVQILNSHPRVAGFPGEANELWHPALEPFERAALDIPPIEIDPKAFTAASIAAWPPEQPRTLRRIFTGFHMMTGRTKSFFTKSAMISFMLPEILDVFPDAMIIHIHRFGPSVVESYVKKNFGKYSRFVYSETEYRAYCARYWNSCILEIAQRKGDLLDGERFLELSYEALCADPNQSLGRIASFLAIEPQGFKFHTSQIASQNDKAPDYARDPARSALLDVMADGMRLAGYL